MNSGRFLVAAVVLLAVAVPTAAVTVAETVDSQDDRVDWEGPEVTLSPHEGPNGAYATVENGELEIAFDRLNDDATTRLHNVFTVEATGDRAVDVWVTTDATGVELYRSDDPGEPIDSQAHAVTLQPGESLAVGFEVDSRESVPESDAITVHADEPVEYEPPTEDPDDTPDETPTETPDGTPGGDAEFVVTNLSAPDEVAVGETTEIVATVENLGDDDGEYLAELVVDGTIVDRRPVSVPADERRTVTFERTFDAPGEYELAVASEQRTITVVEPEEPAASFETSDARVREEEVRVGESTRVDVTVENVGDEAGETTVELVVGGTVVDSRTVELEPGESTTVTFEWTFRQPGVFQVGAGGLGAGEVTVLAGSAAEGRMLSSSIQTVVAGPVLALLLLALLWRRYR